MLRSCAHLTSLQSHQVRDSINNSFTHDHHPHNSHTTLPTLPVVTLHAIEVDHSYAQPLRPRTRLVYHAQ